MSVITKRNEGDFTAVKEMFNEKSELFIKLVIFFAPLIFIAHISGALLDPYYMNAEKYGRTLSHVLLICFSYMWLLVLIEKRTHINPFKEVNLKLLGFLVLTSLCIFIPFEAIKVIQWAFVIGDLHGKSYKFIIDGLYVVATYLIISQSFMLLAFIEDKVIFPYKSIRMAHNPMLPLFKGFVLYMLPISIFIFIYMYGVNFLVMKWEITEQGPIEAIFFSILYAPVFLLVHLFMVAIGFTATYVAYRKAQQAENSINDGTSFP